jgi:hypothetical protein
MTNTQPVRNAPISPLKRCLVKSYIDWERRSVRNGLEFRETTRNCATAGLNQTRIGSWFLGREKNSCTSTPKTVGPSQDSRARRPSSAAQHKEHTKATRK